MKCEPLVCAGALLGEGPVWDAERHVVYWVDIDQGRIHRAASDGSADVFVEVGQSVGSVTPIAGSARILAALAKDGLVALEFETGERTTLADPEADKPANRFNDGKCDPAGRFWVSTLEMANGAVGAGKGSLYCLQPHNTIVRKLESLTIPNGMAWSPDHKTMYFIDTAASCVFAFDYDASVGSIENQRIAFSVPEDCGLPDGMAIDEEGMLWIGLWRGASVARWNPKTGMKIDAVDVPVPHPTSCAFGGPNLDRLYITSARTELSDAEFARYPLAGSVFVCEPGIKGLPVPPFHSPIGSDASTSWAG